MEDIEPAERELLDTPGEAFLLHLEIDKNPKQAHNMVTLKYLIAESGGTKGGVRTEWAPEEIARGFKSYYLEHPDHLNDYPDLARYSVTCQLGILESLKT